MGHKLMDHRKELIKFAWNHLKSPDSQSRHWAYVCVCRFIQVYETPPKIILQVYVALLRTYQTEAKRLVEKALDILTPALPVRLHQRDLIKAIKWTKKIVYEEGHSLPQLIHIWELMSRHPTLFYKYRNQFVPHMVNSLSRLGLPQTCPRAHRRLAIDLVHMIIAWEYQSQLERESVIHEKSKLEHSKMSDKNKKRLRRVLKRTKMSIKLDSKDPDACMKSLVLIQKTRVTSEIKNIKKRRKKRKQKEISDPSTDTVEGTKLTSMAILFKMNRKRYRKSRKKSVKSSKLSKGQAEVQAAISELETKTKPGAAKEDNTRQPQDGKKAASAQNPSSKSKSKTDLTGDKIVKNSQSTDTNTANGKASGDKIDTGNAESGVADPNPGAANAKTRDTSATATEKLLDVKTPMNIVNPNANSDITDFDPNEIPNQLNSQSTVPDPALNALNGPGASTLPAQTTTMPTSAGALGNTMSLSTSSQDSLNTSHGMMNPMVTTSGPSLSLIRSASLNMKPMPPIQLKRAVSATAAAPLSEPLSGPPGIPGLSRSMSGPPRLKGRDVNSLQHRAVKRWIHEDKTRMTMMQMIVNFLIRLSLRLAHLDVDVLTERTLLLLEKALSVWPRVRLKLDYFQMLFPKIKNRGHSTVSKTGKRTPNSSSLRGASSSGVGTDTSQAESDKRSPPGPKSSKLLKNSKGQKTDKRGNMLNEFLRPSPIKTKSSGSFKSLSLQQLPDPKQSSSKDFSSLSPVSKAIDSSLLHTSLSVIALFVKFGTNSALEANVSTIFQLLVPAVAASSNTKVHKALCDLAVESLRHAVTENRQDHLQEVFLQLSDFVDQHLSELAREVGGACDFLSSMHGEKNSMDDKRNSSGSDQKKSTAAKLNQSNGGNASPDVASINSASVVFDVLEHVAKLSTSNLDEHCNILIKLTNRLARWHILQMKHPNSDAHKSTKSSHSEKSGGQNNGKSDKTSQQDASGSRNKNSLTRKGALGRSKSSLPGKEKNPTGDFKKDSKVGRKGGSKKGSSKSKSKTKGAGNSGSNSTSGSSKQTGGDTPSSSTSSSSRKWSSSKHRRKQVAQSVQQPQTVCIQLLLRAIGVIVRWLSHANMAEPSVVGIKEKLLKILWALMENSTHEKVLQTVVAHVDKWVPLSSQLKWTNMTGATKRSKTTSEEPARAPLVLQWEEIIAFLNHLHRLEPLGISSPRIPQLFHYMQQRDSYLPDSVKSSFCRTLLRGLLSKQIADQTLFWAIPAGASANDVITVRRSLFDIWATFELRQCHLLPTQISGYPARAKGVPSYSMFLREMWTRLLSFPWQQVADKFWLPVILHTLMEHVKVFARQHGAQDSLSTAMFPASAALDSNRTLLKDHESFLKQQCKADAAHFLEGLAELSYASTQFAEVLAKNLIPCMWSMMITEDKQEVLVHLVRLLARRAQQMPDKERSEPRIVKILLTCFELSDVVPTNPSPLLQYLAHRHGCWHIAAQLLERQLWANIDLVCNSDKMHLPQHYGQQLVGTTLDALNDIFQVWQFAILYLL